ncbi:C39 family peptidase [Candidatus Saccharibacteria bacterium]|nr:C39 family peptidase [Candidatus Saccharibacteria bacterium]
MGRKIRILICSIVSIFVTVGSNFSVQALANYTDREKTVWKETKNIFWNPYEGVKAKDGECPDGYIATNSNDGDSSSSSGSDSGGEIPQGDDAASIVIGYLMKNGYTKEAAAAVAANLMVESGINPRKLEGGKIVPEDFVAYSSSGKTFSGGFGIAQWTTAGRVKNLQDYANSTGRKVTSLSVQVEFVLKELTGAYASSSSPGKVNGMDLAHAVWQIRKYYETPGGFIWTTHNGKYYNDYIPNSLEELSETKTPAAYNEFKKAYNAAQSMLGITPSDDFPTDSSSANIVCVPDPNYDGDGSDYEGGDGSPVNVNGYIFYSQCDPSWKNLYYGLNGVKGPDGNAICKSGCGPTSFAVIATNLLHRSITPGETADIAGKAGMHTKDKNGNYTGSSHSITSVLGKHYGLNVVKISKSIDAINSYLSKGYMIHTSGSGAAPFTSGGHYIAIVARLSDGRWLVGDSSKNGPSGIYNPSTVMAGMKADNVWAVGVN